MDNMTYWDALKQPPPEALKTIQGGRLKGKTDINPQWRYKAMTEQFGVCGIGWKYNIERLWLEPAQDEVCAFAEVGLSIKVDGEWSAPIPGIGGSMLIAKESSGLHVSDEAYKMAITDALSVAMKMIGVAADIYAGLFDGSKYTEEKKPAQSVKKEKPEASIPETSEAPVEQPQEKTEEAELPKTIQALYNWIASHGKKYGRTWFLQNFNYTEEELKQPERVEAAYKEIKAITGWS